MTPRPSSSGPDPKKTAAKQAAEQKTAGKQAAAKKAPSKKTAKTTEGAGTAKAGVKKTATKKSAAKKAVAHKAVTKTAVTKKATAKKAAAGKSAAKKPAARKATAPAVEIAVSPSLDAGDRERLLAGTHHDPHSVLGAHRVPGGVAFRALRPYAREVTVLSGDLRVELHDDGDGFFSGLLPLREVPLHRLRVAYEETVQEVEDPYRFLPTLGELDLHLIGEGRHEQLWQALGAHPMTHDGVAGTRFTVWAPNARGVRVAGGFNFWDGTGHPMRSLGATGVWELFLPGVGAGELYKFEITPPHGTRPLRAPPRAPPPAGPPAPASGGHAPP
ncbi:1,4-alpha-glucan branching enzyme, partial [Streptomyces sp. NPDC057074]